MLSKVNSTNWLLGTNNIIKYVNEIKQSNQNYSFELIQDNLDDYLLIKSDNQILFYNYKTNLSNNKIKQIRLKILGKYFWKQIESFDQNNITIGNKLRKFIIEQFDNLNSNSSNSSNIFLGIGGESYIYSPIIKHTHTRYIFLSNHLTIISDANFNLKFYNLDYSNYLVNYNNIDTFPKLLTNLIYNVVINVSNLHQNHIIQTY